MRSGYEINLGVVLTLEAHFKMRRLSAPVNTFFQFYWGGGGRWGWVFEVNGLMLTAFFKVQDNVATVTVKCLECQEDVAMTKFRQHKAHCNIKW